MIILVGKDGRPSMKGTFSQMKSNVDLRIRRQFINIKGIQRIFYRNYTNHSIINYKKLPINTPINDDIIVRWGTQQLFEGTNNIVYNEAKYLAIASNKKRTREELIKNGVCCPKLYGEYDGELNFSIDELDFPIIARPHTHSKGRNFVVLKNKEEFELHFNKHKNEWYYSEFIDKVAEFRIHVAHGRILNYLEKPKPKNSNQIAWNRAINVDPFINVKWNNYNSHVAHIAIDAVRALKLDFGGVDVIVTEDGTPFVLEVNTAPTLVSSDYSMKRYALYFDWLNKEPDTKRKHWELPKKLFKNPKNYAWHSYHFEDRNPNN